MSKTAVEKQPKYSIVAQELRERIRSGVLRPGDRLPSYAAMRARGVSQPVLDRVHQMLEHDGLIERQHGRGVFVAERREKTLPRQNVLGLVGLHSEGWGHPYWAHLLAGVRDAAHTAGCDVMLLDINAPLRWERMDGLIMSGYGGVRAGRERLEMMPAVGLLVGDVPGLHTVDTDDRGAAMQATQHLLALGHRNIAHLAAAGNERIAGYQAALRAAGIRPRAEWVRLFLEGQVRPGWKFADHGRDAMTRWLADGWRDLGCTALICHNDEVALGALRALREAGLSVPQDVSLVGFDGTELAAHADPPLTTMQMPLEAIGARGVELLLQEMQQPTQLKGSHCERLAAHLKQGESSTPPTRRTMDAPAAKRRPK